MAVKIERGIEYHFANLEEVVARVAKGTVLEDTARALYIFCEDDNRNDRFLNVSDCVDGAVWIDQYPAWPMRRAPAGTKVIFTGEE